MATFQFELVAPERVLFSGPVASVDLPATEGAMTVLPGHAPFMTTLKTGFLVVVEEAAGARRILVQGGFADVAPGSLTVLAERALPFEEVTHEMLDLEIARVRHQRDATEDQAARLAADMTISDLTDARNALRS